MSFEIIGLVIFIIVMAIVLLFSIAVRNHIEVKADDAMVEISASTSHYASRRDSLIQRIPLGTTVVIGDSEITGCAIDATDHSYIVLFPSGERQSIVAGIVRPRAGATSAQRAAIEH
jgi:hypothetical protein